MSDLIKREDAIEALNECVDIKGYAYTSMHDALMELPSADRPKGKWIDKHEWANGFYERECSICGAMKPQLMHTAKINFCPNCGADMRGVDE